MGIDNAGVVWGDGLAIPAEVGPFDRIFVEGRLDDGAEAFAHLLADGGILVFGRNDPQRPVRQQVVRLQRSGDEWIETPLGPCRMQAILPGLARAL